MYSVSHICAHLSMVYVTYIVNKCAHICEAIRRKRTYSAFIHLLHHSKFFEGVYPCALYTTLLSLLIVISILAAVHLTLQMLQRIWLTNQKIKFYKLINQKMLRAFALSRPQLFSPLVRLLLTQVSGYYYVFGWMGFECKDGLFKEEEEEMRAYAWNGTHLMNIDHGRARDSEFMLRKY